MIEYSDDLLDYLYYHNYALILKINRTGCSGYSIEFEVVYTLAKELQNYNMYDLHVYLDEELWELVVDNDLSLYIDYLDKELIQGVHVSVKNKDMCGCGKSFNVSD